MEKYTCLCYVYNMLNLTCTMNLNVELPSFTQKNVLAYITKFYLSNKLMALYLPTKSSAVSDLLVLA